MNKEKPKVLIELRACLEGFSGIPMETRLIFRSMNNLDNIEPTGLINHPGRRLARGLSPGFLGMPLKPHQSISRLSRLAISVKVDPLLSTFEKFWSTIVEKMETHAVSLAAALGHKIRVYGFDASEFGDFMWQSFFSNTLPASDYELIRTARYASIRPSTAVLYRTAIQRWQSVIPGLPRPIVNTSGYDIFLAQTPWPTRVSPNTQLVIRYHDAIPVFLPHTIEKPAFHQAKHMAALEGCRKGTVFACNSNATRTDLLKIYPELEHRAVIVPDIVSKQYYEEKSSPRYVINTIRSYICTTTEPKFLTSREKDRFYERHLGSGPLRFLLMVSSIDLRKNHAKLIGAWDYLRNHGLPDVKLVFVGELGWDHERIVLSMASAQEKGELFHLTKIPFGQLRLLYKEAAAVVCPSVAEGFDLSGIEAMLCGGAVAASDIPVHREIYGNACEYFNPYSAMDLAKALERVIHPDSVRRREELVEAGLRHAPRYRSEAIEPIWHELFERIRRGEFKRRILAEKSSPGILPDKTTPSALPTARV
jgi:glycosyltransferase involved in cell wall biosynthesis